jgi:hypothetical protein
MYSTRPLISAGVQIGGITALSPELFKIVVDYNATAVWVVDDDEPDYFFVTGKSRAVEQISAPLVIGYNELGVTGKPTEYYDHGELTLGPGESFSLRLTPPVELRGMRVAQLHGQLLGVHKSQYDFEPSEPIVIANSWEIVR